MTSDVRHRVLVSAVWAMATGVMGTAVEGPGIGTTPHLGVYLVLTGLWFGSLVGGGVWMWGGRSTGGALVAVIATWAGWELAINAALQIDAYWTRINASPGWLGMYLAGFAAGAIGAAVTWGGVAVSVVSLRRRGAGPGAVVVGAVMGLLLPCTNHYDNAAVLLVPWQMAVAAWLGGSMVWRTEARLVPQSESPLSAI